MVGTIISTSTSSGITLSSTSSNPITVTGNINVASGYALYLAGGTTKSWTISNSGTIKSGNDNALDIGRQSPSEYVANAIITNKAGGYVAATGGPKSYGIGVFGPGTLVNYGTIKGPVGGAGFNGNATITNFGAIHGNASGGGAGAYAWTGKITNEANATIAGQYGVKIEKSTGPSTVVNFGTIDGLTSAAVQFSANNSGDKVIDEPGGVFLGGGIYGGTGTLELASASSAQTLSPAYISSFSTIQFDSAHWLVGASYSNLYTSTITGFVSGDTIDVTNFAATGSSFSGGTLTLTNASTSTSLTFLGTLTQSDFVISSANSGAGTDIALVCFCRGTYIATPTGDVLVEKLSVGDWVLTLSGQAQAIKWIGTGRHIVKRGERCSATPIVVRRDAFADDVPNRDLYVTKGHSFLFDDVLIPVEFLVNHRSILWDDRAQGVEIYHIELETHDVLLANGAPAESYRDDGNRRIFQNSNGRWNDSPRRPFAPVRTGGAVVDAAWRQLLDRSGPRKRLPLTSEPDLHLVVDGLSVEPMQRNDEFHVFTLPTARHLVKIVSRAASPQELGIARDPRCLGVALRKLMVRRGTKFITVRADDIRLVDGYHAYEAKPDFRWTSGAAVVPADLFADFDGPVELVIQVASASTYLDEGERSKLACQESLRPVSPRYRVIPRDRHASSSAAAGFAGKLADQTSRVASDGKMGVHPTVALQQPSAGTNPTPPSTGASDATKPVGRNFALPPQSVGIAAHPRGGAASTAGKIPSGTGRSNGRAVNCQVSRKARARRS